MVNGRRSVLSDIIIRKICQFWLKNAVKVAKLLWVFSRLLIHLLLPVQLSFSRITEYRAHFLQAGRIVCLHPTPPIMCLSSRLMTNISRSQPTFLSHDNNEPIGALQISSYCPGHVCLGCLLQSLLLVVRTASPL